MVTSVNTSVSPLIPLFVSDKLCKLEWKHEYANSEFLKHFAQVSELLELTAKGAQERVKLANKMLILPSLLDGE